MVVPVVVVVVPVVVVVVPVLVMVVVVTVTVAFGALGGLVVVPLDPAAELQAVAPEIDLLVGEGGERGLVGLGRQRFGPDRLEVADLRPRPEPARHAGRPPLVHLGAHDGGPVGEPGADALDPLVVDLQLVVLPVDDVRGQADALDERVGEVAQTEVETTGAASRVEVDIQLVGVVVLLRVVVFIRMVVFIRVVVVVVVPVVVVVVPVVVAVLVVVTVLVVTLVLVPVRVELARERHAVAAVLGREPAADERPVAEPADAGPRVPQFGGRVLDGPFRGVVVARPTQAAAAPEEQAALRVLHAGRSAGLPVRAARVDAELPPRALEQRFALAFVRRDRVDEAADGVRAVEQRRRAADDLDALDAVRVDRDPVVARLAGEVAGAHAVFENEHTVAVETPDDGPFRARPETADRNARLVLQRLADRVGALRRDVERIEGGDGVEGLERGFGPAGRGGDGQLFVDRRQIEHEVHGRRPAGGDDDLLAAGREVLALGDDLVRAGRHVVERELALLVGHADRAGADHQDHGAVHRVAVVGQRDPAGDGAGLLRPRRRGRRHNGGRRKHGRESHHCPSILH